MASIQQPSACRPSPVPEPRSFPDALAGRWKSLATAAFAQGAGLILAAGAARVASQHFGVSPPLPLVAAAAGVAAAACGAALGLPRWWRVIHSLLPPAAWAALAIGIAPAWYLAAFIASALVFSAAAGGAVPLYLSGARDIEALADLLPARARVLDAGCGIGTVLAGLGARRPDAVLEGVESAVLPWLAARLRAGGRCRVRWRSLWGCDFGRYDVVYVFLSPAPMGRLWEKARREMRPGALLVSNRFSVPGVAPTQTLRTGPGDCRLHVWRM